MPDPICLNYRSSISLYPRPPFHFTGTVCKPSYFPTSDILFKDGIYWQSLRFHGRVIGLRMEPGGSAARPEVQMNIFSAVPLDENEIEGVATEIRYRFNLDANLTPFLERFREDEVLGPALTRWWGMRPSSNASLYEYLVLSTVLQNASVRRTVQMHENLLRVYGSQVAFAGHTFSAYWEPSALAAASEEDLRALKVGYRAKALKRQAELIAAGVLDEDELRGLLSPELKQKLISIYGIGPASVWYLMFGVFKRYDAFEHISPWEQKIFSHLLFDQELVDAQEILAMVDRRWGEWKMLAAHYLFEDLFWRRRNEPIPWLEKLIRLSVMNSDATSAEPDGANPATNGAKSENVV